MSKNNEFSEYLAILKLLDQSQHNKKPTEDDKTFRQNVTNEISHRDEQYTELLVHFVHITKIRNCLKEIFKWTFYLAVIISMLSLILIINKVFNKFISHASIQQLIEAIPLFITSIVGFVSVIIAIPIAITKYLFSTKEDKNITDIILHTQEHDTTGRQWTLDFKKLLEKANKPKTNDDNQVNSRRAK